MGFKTIEKFDFISMNSVCLRLGTKNTEAGKELHEASATLGGLRTEVEVSRSCLRQSKSPASGDRQLLSTIKRLIPFSPERCARMFELGGGGERMKTFSKQGRKKSHLGIPYLSPTIHLTFVPQMCPA